MKKVVLLASSFLIMGYAYSVPYYFQIPFRKAHCTYVADTPQLLLVEQIYNNFIATVTISDSPRIPTIIHQIWLGSPVPERYTQLQQSFKDIHPEWQYILWTEDDIEQLQLQNYAAYVSAHNYGEKSDIARYEILYRFGGVYVDLDVRCLDSFDILHRTCDFYACLTPMSEEVKLENCIIGCAPGHPIIKECVETLQGQDLNQPGYFGGIIQGTGPGHITRSFFSKIEQSQQQNLVSIALPLLFFFSPDLFCKKEIQIMPFLALHYWEGTWQEPEHRWHHKAWQGRYEERFK